MAPRLWFAALITLTASIAHAWENSFRTSFDVTTRGTIGTFETTSNATKASDQAEREARTNRSSNDPQCRIDPDCPSSQYCEQGRCVQPVASPPTPQPRVIPGCADDSQCAPGYTCVEARCVERAQPQAAPLSSSLSPSLERRGTELYLRERAAQLRQDVALGEGPVLSSLALEHKVTVRKLGLILRANRAELKHLVGDRADTAWPARFLDRVDELLAPKCATRGAG